jgi:hypothetical protein
MIENSRIGELETKFEKLDASLKTKYCSQDVGGCSEPAGK